MKKYIGFLVCTFVAVLPVSADEVDWSMVGGAIYTNSSFSAIVPLGTTVRLGTFGTGYDFTGKNFTSLETDFVSWGSDSTNIDGQFAATGTATAGPLGTPWYIFVGSSSASFGIFSNTAWKNSNDPFAQAIDLAQSGNFAAGGFGTVGTGPNAGSVALVPEPSSLALLGLGAGLLLWRRRRVS